MLIETSKIKPNDGSFKGGYRVSKTTTIVVLDCGDGTYMCLHGQHRIKGKLVNCTVITPPPKAK